MFSQRRFCGHRSIAHASSHLQGKFPQMHLVFLLPLAALAPLVRFARTTGSRCAARQESRRQLIGFYSLGVVLCEQLSGRSWSAQGGTEMRKAMILITVVAASLEIGTAQAGQQYSLTPLNFVPQAINSSGCIVGDGSLWTPNMTGGGSITQLSYGLSGINASGQVVGDPWFNPGYKVVLWTPSAGAFPAVSLPDVNTQGSENFTPPAINDTGLVVGSGWDFYGGGGFRSFLWKPTTPNGTSGSMISLGGGSGAYVIPWGINSTGEVVGWDPTGVFLWKPSVPNGTQGTKYHIGVVCSDYWAGEQINSVGQIAGTASVGTTNHAFLWTPNSPNATTGAAVDLGSLSGGSDESQAKAINSAGVVVGESRDESLYDGRAFVWTSASGIQDLNQMLDGSGANWTLQAATGINDNGLIIGWGLYDPDGPGGNAPLTQQGFLLTPIPEPATLSLLALGGLAMLRRRKAA